MHIAVEEILKLLPENYIDCIKSLYIEELKGTLSNDQFKKAKQANIIVSLKPNPYHLGEASATLCKLLNGDYYWFNKENEIIDVSDESTNEHLLEMIIKRLASIFSFETFDCCSSVNECSKLKRCVHDDPIYSFACTYREKLESGTVFF